MALVVAAVEPTEVRQAQIQVDLAVSAAAEVVLTQQRLEVAQLAVAVGLVEVEVVHPLAVAVAAQAAPVG